MSDPQLADVARVCNRYPDIEVEFDVVGGETVTAGEPVQLIVRMDRSLPEGQELAPVHAPRSAYLLCEVWDTLQLAVYLVLCLTFRLSALDGFAMLACTKI